MPLSVSDKGIKDSVLDPIELDLSFVYRTRFGAVPLHRVLSPRDAQRHTVLCVFPVFLLSLFIKHVYLRSTDMLTRVISITTRDIVIRRSRWHEMTEVFSARNTQAPSVYRHGNGYALAAS